MTAADYRAFLAAKHPAAAFTGPDVTADDVHPMLHDWQSGIVRWACKVGRASIWADTGLGKTFMQLEWARLAAGDGIALIVAPLAVCAQTVREAAKLDIKAEYVRDGDRLGPGIYVTNYEMVDRFDPGMLTAVVLDEASILKQSDGKTRTRLIQRFASVPYRLACTATPAPNDPEELTNQAEFLGHSTRVNMLAAYFVHDDDGWRQKKHAVRPMARWMATWAVALRRPSDVGHYDDHDYELPGLRILPSLLAVNIDAEWQLFPTDLGGVGGRAKVRRDTTEARCARAVQLVDAEPDESWMVWCGLNAEQDRLTRAFGDRCFSVYGNQTPETKADAILRWIDGERPILLTKPKIAGYGMNFQHCARMAFVGLSDSYESYYQSIRRCYRYGQTRIVDAHIILSELESQIAANVQTKEQQSSAIISTLIAAMREGTSM